MTATQLDPYAVLGVGRDANQSEISRAYRALLRRHHPDTRPSSDEPEQAGSDATLQQVLASYAVLGDPLRRAAYDHHASSRSQSTHEPPQRAYVHGRRAGAQPPIIAGPVIWLPTQEGPSSR